VATLLVLIDFTTVVPTIQDTAATFGASVGWRTWALSAMSLGLAAALLTAGAMADQIGRRRTLRAGMAALTAALITGRQSWSAAPTLLLLSAAVACVAAFAVVEGPA
jgi:MFS family permease